MYRAMTLKALRLKVDLTNEDALVELAKNTSIGFVDVAGKLQVTLDGENVADAIRAIEVTNNTFYIARTGGVRELMVKWQREIAERHPIVTDGRDQGTVVFPTAKYKFYVDASLEERTGRRYRELQAAGKTVDFNQLMKEMKERDDKDFNRAVGPLKKADDAIVIDSDGLTVEGTVEVLMKYIQL
jgi:cytidylate kinase